MGDLLLSDRFLELSRTSTYWQPFDDSALKDLVRQHDLVIASLDCAVSNPPTLINGDRIIVETGTSAIRYLLELHVGLVSTATNHAFDFGLLGYQKTEAALAKCGIAAVGAGKNQQEAAKPMILNINNTRLGVFAGAAVHTSAVIAGEIHSGVNLLDNILKLEATAASLRSLCDAIVFLPHWGTEWYTLPSPSQREIANRLIAAGVDIIIGNHPHVVQMYEYISTKPVFYALGNTVAPEFHHTGAEIVKQLHPNRTSLAVSVEIDANGLTKNVNIYKLYYDHQEKLSIRGKRSRSDTSLLFKILVRNDRMYKITWMAYTAFMEIFYIPIRYRLFGYGPSYFFRRLKPASIIQRLRQLKSRISRE